MATEKRLISLDEALEATHKEVWWTESEASAIRSFLLKLPRADAVEVVHGQWVEDDRLCRRCCSECGFVLHDDACNEMYGNYMIKPNYCPNCGSKMDGDGNA